MFIPGNLWRNPSYRVSHFICKDSTQSVDKVPFLLVEFIRVVDDSSDVEVDDGLAAGADSRKARSWGVKFLTPYCKSVIYMVRGTNVRRPMERFS